jgi:hypothetical protein
MPFMHSEGDYSGTSQGVIYGLGDIAASWPSVNATYGPPPYTNYLGETVTSINNTYVDHMIEVALGLPPEGRQAVYNELMDIFYAEAATLPVYFSYGRHYERTWISGWYGTWNSNPISPGLYFYTIRKVPPATIHEVDVSATSTITNETTVYPLIQVFEGKMMLGGSPVYVNYTITVKYVAGDTDIIVYVGTYRNDTTVANWTIGDMRFWKDFEITLSPGENKTYTAVKWYESTTMWAGVWTIGLWADSHGATNGDVALDNNTANNKQDNPYTVTAKELPGDLDASGVVDIFDAIIFAGHFGTVEGGENWDPLCDLNGDGMVDIFDAIILASNFGRSIP